MRLITYLQHGRTHTGVVDQEHTVHSVAGADISDAVTANGASSSEPAPTHDLVWAIENTERVATWAAGLVPGSGTPVTDVQLLAPFPRPRRNVFCIGKNYADHVNEVKGTGGTGEAPTTPIVFTKPPSSVVGPEAGIESFPRLTRELDYEAELAVIIGRGGRDIAASDAASHIWGYTIVNDVSARDRQRDHKQWLLGKGLDTFCPMGPSAVSADEIDPEGTARPDLRVRSRVNGEPRQDGSTLDLIFDIPTLIEALSAGLTLEAGDVIATGTPAGVGAGFDPPRYLTAGDVVEVEISGLGTLRNVVV